MYRRRSRISGLSPTSPHPRARLPQGLRKSGPRRETGPGLDQAAAAAAAAEGGGAGRSCTSARKGRAAVRTERLRGEGSGSGRTALIDHSSDERVDIVSEVM
jgi:hypothetical protein